MITKKLYILILCFLFTNFHNTSIYAQKKVETSRILFILDASQSMLGRWQSGRKIDIAKKLLINMIDSLKNMEELEIGLRVYGAHKNYPPQDCEDTKLVIDFLPSKIASERIKAKLKTIRARNTTPIAKSLEEGAKDFPDNNSRNIVILITDGKEECGMDPCAVSRLYQREGIILKPFVIGVGLEKSWKESFDCVGTFFDASKEEDFENILNIVISHVIDNTTVQVNLLDDNGFPTETNVALTFYDNFTGLPKYNYVHTMNHKGNPDTMIIDPILSYKVVAHTIPPVTSNIITLKPGKHTIIPINSGQGKLEVKMNSKISYPFILRKTNEIHTVNIQNTNTVGEYLTGTYQIELLSLPRMYLEDVQIKQSQKTSYTIPEPGIVNILLPSTGFGGIYKYQKDKLEEVYRFKDIRRQHKLNILPGNYKIIFKAKAAKQYIYTIEKDIKVKSGKSKIIKIY